MELETRKWSNEPLRIPYIITEPAIGAIIFELYLFKEGKT